MLSPLQKGEGVPGGRPQRGSSLRWGWGVSMGDCQGLRVNVGMGPALGGWHSVPSPPGFRRNGAVRARAVLGVGVVGDGQGGHSGCLRLWSMGWSYCSSVVLVGGQWAGVMVVGWGRRTAVCGTEAISLHFRQQTAEALSRTGRLRGKRRHSLAQREPIHPRICCSSILTESTTSEGSQGDPLVWSLD